MPVRKVRGGWKVEGTKTVHKTRAAAERQHRAIKARQNQQQRSSGRRSRRR